MRGLSLLIGTMVLAAALPVQAKRIAPDVRLAKTLDGRVAGKPVRCIQMRQIQSSEIFEMTAILYEAGRTW